MKASDMIPSKYLRSDDIEGEVVVTVKKIGQISMKERDGSETKKWAVKFEEYEQPLVLNKTNITRLTKYCGDDTDGWVGKKVTLYVDHDVQFGSDIVSALRIKAAPAPDPRRVPHKGGGGAIDDLDSDVPFRQLGREYF